jgi:hypothetical protein
LKSASVKEESTLSSCAVSSSPSSDDAAVGGFWVRVYRCREGEGDGGREKGRERTRESSSQKLHPLLVAPLHDRRCPESLARVALY